MELNEALQNKPYKWKWDRNVPHYERRASFQTKFQGHTLSYWVIFSANRPDPKDWSLTFRPSKKGISVLFALDQSSLEGGYHIPYTDGVGVPYRINKTGYPFRKMATVIEILKNFLQDYTPDSVKFTATDQEPSRVKLYRRLVSMVKTNLPGWSGVGGSAPLGGTFYIYRTGKFPRSAEYYYRSAGLPLPESVEASDVVDAVIPVPVSPIHANEIASLSKEPPCRS